METISFLNAMKQVFQPHQGQTPMQLGKEIAALGEADRLDMKADLERITGCTVDISKGAAVFSTKKA